MTKAKTLGRLAPPGDALLARHVGEPQQEVTVARRWSAPANEVMPAQHVECTQQMMLIAQPVFVFCDDARTVAVRAYPERIAPFAPAADVDATSRNA